jgi:hypothetical protein
LAVKSFIPEPVVEEIWETQHHYGVAQKVKAWKRTTFEKFTGRIYFHDIKFQKKAIQNVINK